MVNINFLPWREELRKKQLKHLRITLMLFTTLPIAILFIWFEMLDNQKQILTKDIEKLHITKNRIPNNLKDKVEQNSSLPNEVIKKMMEFNNDTNKLFVGLTKKPSVCFTKIVRNKNKISFYGETISPINFTEFLKNWSMASLFSIMFIHQLRQQSKHLFVFEMQATQISSIPLAKKTND